MGANIRRLQTAVGDMEDIVRFSQQGSELVSLNEGKQLKVKQGKIELKLVDFHYQLQKKSLFTNLL